MSPSDSSGGSDDEPVFGRTMVNGTEYPMVMDLKTPIGRATYGLSTGETAALAQLLQTGLENTDVPDNVQRRVEMMIRSFERTRTIDECREEVAEEQRNMGAI